MKSERRHELKTNELAKGLERLPELGKQYGGRILLAVVVIAVVVVLIRHRINTQRTALDIARQNLAGAYSVLAELREPDPLMMRDMEGFALRRKLATQNAQLAIDAVLGGTRDKALLASALVARGDLNWLIATLPPLPVATTQPALQMDLAPDEAISQAKDSYEEVLRAYPQQGIPVNAARFGLAAVAEQQQEWGTAAQMYEAIQNDERVPMSLKTLASARMMMLEQIKQPIYLADATTGPGDVIATQRIDIPADVVAPLVQAPSDSPADEPSTRPAGPTTAP